MCTSRWRYSAPGVDLVLFVCGALTRRCWWWNHTEVQEQKWYGFTHERILTWRGGRLKLGEIVIRSAAGACFTAPRTICASQPYVTCVCGVHWEQYTVLPPVHTPVCESNFQTNKILLPIGSILLRELVDGLLALQILIWLKWNITSARTPCRPLWAEWFHIFDNIFAALYG